MFLVSKLRQALEEAPLELREDRFVVLEALRSSKGWALQPLRGRDIL